VLHDLVGRFGDAKASNAHWSRLGSGEPSRIELHPPGKGDAVLAFPPITLPTVEPGECLRLVTAFGFDPAACLDDPANPSNGVRFAIRVNGREAVATDHHAPSWLYQNIDLTAHAGKQVEILLVTHAAGNMNWDHAAFRRPQIVRVPASLTDPLRQSLAGPPPRQVFAKADSDKTILLYFAPGAGPSHWQLRPLPAGARYRATWRDPRSGAATPAAALAVGDGSLPLPAPPDADDWVLILEREG
jgi:hypothetical protein